MWNDVIGWLVEILLYLPRKLYEFFVDVVLYLFNLIDPLPISPGAIDSVVSASGGVGWFLDLAAFDVGFSMVMVTLLARFTLRRIPGIG